MSSENRLQAAASFIAVHLEQHPEFLFSNLEPVLRLSFFATAPYPRSSFVPDNTSSLALPKRHPPFYPSSSSASKPLLCPYFPFNGQCCQSYHLLSPEVPLLFLHRRTAWSCFPLWRKSLLSLGLVLFAHSTHFLHNLHFCFQFAPPSLQFHAPWFAKFLSCLDK